MSRGERESKNMGSCCSEKQSLIMMLTIILILSSLKSCVMSVVNDGDYESSFLLSLSHNNAYPPESFDGYIPIENVSGEDQSENESNGEGSLLEGFRVLLGLKSFQITRSKSAQNQNGKFPSPSPSPSPSPFSSEVESPTPSVPPISHIHVKPHSQRHSFHSLPNPQNAKSNAKRVLTAILVSTGVAILLCVAFLIVAWKKYKTHHKKPKTRISVMYGKSSRGRSNNKSSSSNTKVTLNPGLDLLYIESSSKDLEQPQQAQHRTPNNAALFPERDHESGREPELEDSNSSSTREITSVHDDSESSSFPSGRKIVPIDEYQSSNCHDDENESFHSFGESNSSIAIRLSNASLGSSFSDALDILHSNEATNTDPQKESKQEKFEASNQSSISQNNLKTPPPPPPPPPLAPPRLNFLPSHPNPKMESTLSISSSVSSKSNVSKSPTAGGIPPPPGPPPRPPPPSQIVQSSLPKLKPLHWDKVRATPDQSMVWDKIRSSSFEFDEEMIESLFGYNIQNSMRNEEGKSKTPSPSKHVLEPKRLQNITILSKALNVSSERVCEAILQGNGLSVQQLEALVKMAPTKEEEGKLCCYKGDINELGSAEKFVKAMLNIPFAFQRLQAMLYRETFDDEVVHLRNSFSMLEEACKELKSSRLFHKLLEAVLKTGNRMNVGTIRGGATAFKLDALLKLADVKGTDGKTTLLHFVVQEITRSTGLDLVSGLSTDLFNVKKTAATDLDVLASSVSNLADGAERLSGLIGSDDGFGEVMRGFLGYAERRLKELREEEEVVMWHVREVTEYFHGNNSVVEVNPLRIFVIVRDFLGMLDHVCKELRSSSVTKSPNPLPPFR